MLKLMLSAECATRLRRRAESALRLLGEAFKCGCVPDCQVGEYFTVEFHASLLEAVDELVVAHPISLAAAPMRTIHSDRNCRLRCLRPEYANFRPRSTASLADRYSVGFLC